MADICAAATAPIVPIFQATIGGVEQSSVDARTLHTLLKSGNTFCHWFNARVQKYQLRAGQDYEPTAESVNDAETSRMGRPPKDYHFALEAAKGLTLAENTAHAQSIWRQLIAWERSMQPQGDTAGDYTRISTSQAQTLKEQVNACVKKTALHHQTVWTAFQHRFCVNSYLELPASKFDEACAYLRDSSLLAAPESHQATPVASWAAEIQHTIHRRAWDLAAETLPVFQQFLEQYVAEHTDGTAQRSADQVAALLQPLRLDDCLAQRYAYSRLHQARNIVCDTQRRTAELFAEMETRLQMLENQLVTTSLPRT